MNASAIAVGVTLSLAGMIAFLTVDRYKVDLLAFMWWRWAILVVMYATAPFGYSDIRSSTWTIVALSLLAFTLGYVASLGAGQSLVSRNRQLREPARAPRVRRQGISPYKALSALFLLGATLFLLYAFNVIISFGLEELLFAPHRLRIAISQGQVPQGFHYFYFLEVVPPLGLAALRFLDPTPRGRRLITAAIFVSFVLLLGTTGRVNAIKSVVWTVLVYVYTARPPSLARNSGRRLNGAKVALAGVGVLVGFTLVGNFLGKSYENSPLASQGIVDIAQPIRGIALPWHYQAAPLPTLDALLHDDAVQFTGGKLSLLPLVKGLGLVFPSLEVPSHIGSYYSIPYEFNVATQIDTMYKDGRVGGVAASSVVLGMIAGHISFLRRLRPDSARIVLLYSLVALVLFASTSSAAYIKPSYWLQFALIFYVGGLIDRDAARSGFGRKDTEA